MRNVTNSSGFILLPSPNPIDKYDENTQKIKFIKIPNNNYISDFEYWPNEGKSKVLEVKGKKHDGRKKREETEHDKQRMKKIMDEFNNMKVMDLNYVRNLEKLPLEKKAKEEGKKRKSKNDGIVRIYYVSTTTKPEADSHQSH